jgi:hypothetical protein
MNPRTKVRVYYKKGCDRDLQGNTTDRPPFETTLGNLEYHVNSMANKVSKYYELNEEGMEIIPIQNKKPNQKFKKLD